MHHLRCTCAYVHITEPKQLTIYLTFHNTLTFAQKMVVQCTIGTTQCYFSHKLQLVNKILIQRVTLLEFQFQVRSKAKETFLGVCFLCSLYISRLAIRTGAKIYLSEKNILGLGDFKKLASLCNPIVSQSNPDRDSLVHVVQT